MQIVQRPEISLIIHAQIREETYSNRASTKDHHDAFLHASSGTLTFAKLAAIEAANEEIF